MMKLDVAERIVSADRIEQGAWMQLTRPNSTDLLFADEKGDYPAMIKVRSYRAKDIADARYRAQAAQASARGNKVKTVATVIREAAETQRPREFAMMAASMKNLDSTQLGKEITPSEDDLLAIAKLPEYQWLVDQVMNFGYTDANFGLEEETKGKNDDGAK